MKKAIILFMILGVMASCGGDGPKEVKLEDGEKVTSSFANGTPQVLMTYEQVNSDVIAVYEREFYEDGNLLKEGPIDENNRHGDWKSYYRNGEIRNTSSYKHGVVDDSIKGYYPDGVLKFIGVYKDGQKTGTWLFYDEKGNLTENQVFLQAGEKREETIYVPED